MEIINRILLTILLIFILGCDQTEQVTQYIPTEHYPEDTLLLSLKNKRAAVVTAHDDDMCIMSGTIAKLHKEGWKIISICFTDQVAKRNSTHIKATKDILDSVVFIGPQVGTIRYDLGPDIKAHEAIPKTAFRNTFNYPAVERVLTEILNDFSPSVLFTLDNEIGGYGHPGHVFISQLVLDIADQNLITPQYIYQGVFTNHMEETILDQRLGNKLKALGLRESNWEKAKKVYDVQGMPEPNIQVTITDVAQIKMNYLLSYGSRERKNIGYYLPAFDQYPAKDYFKMFDREFFRIIKLN